jgi:hypothetical protein
MLYKGGYEVDLADRLSRKDENCVSRSPCFRKRIIVLLPETDQFKIYGSWKKGARITLIMMSKICVNLCNQWLVCLSAWLCSPQRGAWRFVRKGLEGFSHGVAGAGARERGAPQSPVFCEAKNAP